MERLAEKVFLIVGTHGCGKTALAQRISEDLWVEQTRPTIGLDQQAGSLHVWPDGERLRDDLHVLMPEGGVQVRLWEIGGKDGKNRSAPRGQPVDGLFLCYDIGDRSSFQTAAHILMQHRSDRHRAYESATVTTRMESPPRLVVVLCGTRADDADEAGGHVVSYADQLEFVERSGLNGAFVTSAKTGEGMAEAFQALLLASLEAKEEAEADRVAEAKTAQQPFEMFSLASPNSVTGSGCARDLNTMTSPRGLRPHEPSRGMPAAPVVEVIDHHGTPYGARPLLTCLQLGLAHRVVHVWLCDPRTGGLLSRRYSYMAPKEPCIWGPSARGEVLCYQQDQQGQQTAELSFDTARRVLREQLGYEQSNLGNIEHWASSTSINGNVRELIEVYAVDVGLDGLPDFQMRKDEDVEWVHFTDIFGREGMSARQLFYIEPTYRAAMVQKMRKRIEHAHSESGNSHPAGLARGRPQCPLPIVASKHI